MFVRWQPIISTRMLGWLFQWTVWKRMKRAVIGCSRYECFTESESEFPSKTCVTVAHSAYLPHQLSNSNLTADPLGTSWQMTAEIFNNNRDKLLNLL